MTESQFQSWLIDEQNRLRFGNSELSEVQRREREAILNQLANSDPGQVAQYEAFLHAYYRCDQGFDEAYGVVKCHGGEAAEPWQLLACQTRVDLAQKFGKSEIFRLIGLAFRRDLRRLWRQHEGEWPDANVEDDDNLEAWEPATPVLGESSHGDSDGDTIAAFAIDFRRFTNSEILACMAEWLKEHRPINRPEPNRRGRKTRDFRVALERLGLMRLLHRHTPGELRLRLPAAWQLYGHKAESFRREVKAAVETFHRLLPFLPAHEFPKSFTRRGARGGAGNRR